MGRLRAAEVPAAVGSRSIAGVRLRLDRTDGSVVGAVFEEVAAFEEVMAFVEVTDLPVFALLEGAADLEVPLGLTAFVTAPGFATGTGTAAAPRGVDLDEVNIRLLRSTVLAPGVGDPSRESSEDCVSSETRMSSALDSAGSSGIAG